jgi:hypothetical protein
MVRELRRTFRALPLNWGTFIGSGPVSFTIIVCETDSHCQYGAEANARASLACHLGLAAKALSQRKLTLGFGDYDERLELCSLTGVPLSALGLCPSTSMCANLILIAT